MKVNFTYGDISGKASTTFRMDLFERLNLRKLFSGKKVLDLGCGFGLDSLSFSKFAKSVVGSDIIHYEDWEKNSRKNIKFIVANSKKSPFKDNEFDAIYMKDLLHHVDNPEKVLKEVKRVSSGKATIVILEGNRYNPLFYLLVTKLRGHEHFSQNNFKRMVKKYFPDADFLYIEAYPPFFLKNGIYKHLVPFEKRINRIKFLSPFFSYNAAIIKGVK